MSLFVCPLCLNDRSFKTFSKFFRHVTLFHQNESKFHMSCDLSLSCGTSYRTYAAYKSHIYRHHFDQLHVLANKTDVLESSHIDNTLQFNLNDDDNTDLSTNDANGFNTTNDNEDEDEDNNVPINLFESISNKKDDVISISDIQKSFALFILQLREEFLLPKSTTSSISTYIVTLLNHLQSLFEQQVMHNDTNITTNISSSKSRSEPTKTTVDITTIKNKMNEVCYAVETISRNEYQFLKFCEQHFCYRPPEEIVLSSHGESLQLGYFIPIDQTIQSILRNEYIIIQILDNMKQQRDKVIADEDLMFSFRDGRYGSRIDDDSLAVQLYIDDIGVTNPLGAKKDKHKMSMIYFSLEDVPDQHRSQLDNIHLVGICESKILKVKLFRR
jgi:hypothetical protein